MSIIAIRNIPPKNDMTAIVIDSFSLKLEAKLSAAFGRISIIDTYTMTPAEKPRLTERKRRLVLFETKAMRLPMPVESPAIRVSKNAINILSIIMTLTL